MSNNIIDLKGGIYFYTTQEESILFHELKKMLRRLNVPYRDDCCEDEYCPEILACSQLTDNDSYVFEKTIADTVWTIAHSLGFNPNVQVIATDGTNVIGEISYIDNNNLTITFNQAYSGKAYLS